MTSRIILLINFLIISYLGFSQAQYFGQNKPRYKTFGFKVLQSPHYELYHYFDNKETPNKLLINSEHWYKIHQDVFKLSFIKPNPLIIYKNHPDFQETTAIGGQIGEGTGGVTEGFKNRVVMPMMYSQRQTDHVLGHELVHAFQYQLMQVGDSSSLANIQNLPLFMVEGLAEYMSLGRQDSHTAMWMRDAVLSNDIPTVRDLITKQYKYFPYRWGQAFWSFVAATYGDDIIRPLFKETALYGVEVAFARNLKMDTERFSAKWKKALIDAYSPLRQGTTTQAVGKELASAKTMGEMNISPALSPDGNYLAYISSKNIISIDIFIADANTGKIVNKIASEAFGGHVDSYSFLETAGTWSPDSRKFAVVVQVKGKNKLVVLDLARDSKRTYELKGVDSFTNPAWSPNGDEIVVSGLMDGSSDLYLFDLKNEAVKNLTTDDYSDIQPSWSPDGRWIYFVSDRSQLTSRLEKANFSISRLNIETKQLENFSFFAGADNLNPVVSPDGNEIYFLSDRDGFRNLYSYNIESKQLEQLTNYFTGISGITLYSPAITISQRTGQIVYTYFQEGKYSLFSASRIDFKSNLVENKVDKIAGTLAPIEWQSGRNIVNKNLAIQNLVARVPEKSIKSLVYKPKFKLDYLANSGLGVATGRFGTGIGGGITGLFSDMLGNNQLAGTVAMNGQIQDFGGQFFYMNQKRPLQWGLSISRIPFRFQGGYRDSTTNTVSYFKSQFITDSETKNSLGVIPGDSLIQDKYLINRLAINQIGAFAFLPLSSSRRLEGGIDGNWYGFSGEEYADYSGYDPDTRRSYFLIQDRPKRLSKEYLQSQGFNAFNLRQIYLAYVGDNTVFGTVAPLRGYRYRFEAGRYFGTTSYTNILVDVRKYHYMKPFTLAGRVLYNGRLNPTNLNFINQINPLYLGFPWYMHGFFGRAMIKQQSLNLITQEALQGEQLLVGNFEVRLPFTGPKKLALIDFNYAPSDLNFFLDAGMVWSADSKIGQNQEYQTIGRDPITLKVEPRVMTGLSLRVNVMGYFVLEPYVAIPYYSGKFQSAVTGMNFMIPGW
ncbi:MAG: tolB protein precursor [Spirosomataceae bacterium]